MNSTGITITAQTIITMAAVIAAVIALFKYYNKVYDLVKHQKQQDEDIKSIKAEQALMSYGMLACLKAMHEDGHNGAVTDAIDKFEKHLNQAAHGQI